MKKRILSFSLVFTLILSVLFSAGNTYVFATDNRRDLFKTDVYNAAVACQEKIDFAKEPYSSRNYNYNQDQADAIINEVIDEKPELFNVSEKTYSYIKETGKVLSVSFKYRYKKDVYDSMKTQYTAKGLELIADLKESDLSDMQKALVLHDRIATLCEYDYANFLNNRVPNDSFNMYGVLVKNVAVCEGYAKTYMWLLSELGIKSRLCKSKNKVHVWNIVTIDGKEYHVDVTYDDPTWDTYGGVSHKYFLKSSNYFLADGKHSNDFDVTPNTTAYDKYFWDASVSQMCYLDGEIYWVNNENGEIKTFDGTTLFNVTDKWSAGEGYIWEDNYTYLQSGDGLLFFNTSDTVYSYNPQDKVLLEVFKPTLKEDEGIYGLSFSGGNLLVVVTDSPNFSENTKKDCTQTFDIRSTLNDISYATVTNLVAKTFNEGYHTQNPTVMLGAKKLTAGKDYTLSYSGNKWVGTATVTVTGIGGFVGSTTANFKINPANTTISSVSAGVTSTTVKWKKQTRQTSGFEVQYSTSSAFKGAKTATVSGNTKTSVTVKNLTGGKKYYVRLRTYKYSNNVKFYSAYSKAFTVTPNVSVSQTTVTGLKAKTYNGKNQTQSLTVKFGSKKLKNGTDYKISYKNNKWVGTATVTITGKGKYGGTKNLTFKINPKGTSLTSLVADKKKITAKWKKQTTQTTGYQVQFCTNKNFKNATIGTLSNCKATSGLITGLTGGKKYYVRVRTYKKVGKNTYYSAWSSYKSTTAKKK